MNPNSNLRGFYFLRGLLVHAVSYNPHINVFHYTTFQLTTLPLDTKERFEPLTIGEAHKSHLIETEDFVRQVSKLPFFNLLNKDEARLLLLLNSDRVKPRMEADGTAWLKRISIKWDEPQFVYLHFSVSYRVFNLDEDEWENRGTDGWAKVPLTLVESPTRAAYKEWRNATIKTKRNDLNKEWQETLATVKGNMKELGLKP